MKRHSGGNVKVDAGEAQGLLWETGGSVEISSGMGSHQSNGRGGNVRISGGHSAGFFVKEGTNVGGLSSLSLDQQTRDLVAILLFRLDSVKALPAAKEVRLLYYTLWSHILKCIIINEAWGSLPWQPKLVCHSLIPSTLVIATSNSGERGEIGSLTLHTGRSIRRHHDFQRKGWAWGQHSCRSWNWG